MAELPEAGNRSLPLIWAGILAYCLGCWYLLFLGGFLISAAVLP